MPEYTAGACSRDCGLPVPSLVWTPVQIQHLAGADFPPSLEAGQLF